ncbi:type II secretion system protein [Nocardioides aromaticivorans]|uniref:Type II secretion system protein n=1 Tax=Nocardioides aromaticivorans TaxID=200618 RepID=A0ABX7PER0_9ACTN|nr:type II secretion system F family protein [Nocardioides aromaticivorans]QSR24381.1 type II secretion system protein [Nocardioides aromaticivorans]
MAAVLLVAAAVGLLVPGSRRVAADPGARTGRRWPRWWPVLPAAAAGLVAGSPRGAALAVVGLGVALGAARLVRRARAARAASANRARAVELCDAVQAELAAGQTAGQALDRAAADWPLVGPAARAALAGGDVPAALRELAAEPGAGSLRVVAAAWQVAHRTGHGLADALGRVADDLRAAEQTRRIVAGELASARATARLLAGLPFLALAMGAGAGAEPWAFLLGEPAGLACLATGLGLAYAGLAWVEALARGVDGG